MNLLYISDSYLELSVFKSQVDTLCNKHSEYVNTKLLALCNKSEMNIEPSVIINYSVIKHLKYPKMIIPLINYFNAKKFHNIEVFQKADIIHARGHVATLFAINILKINNINKPLISDIRGELVEELKESNSLINKLLSYFAKKLEKKIFNHVNYYFFVSKNMKSYYSNKYSIPTNSSSVFPTIVNDKLFFYDKNKREKIRKELKLENKFVYIYVGGVDYWQNIDQILCKFEDEVKINNNLFLFMIVTDVEYVITLINKYNINIDNIKIDSVPYEQVPHYLNASDAGLIIRNNSIVNNIASPTKINEYLAVKLKIVDNIDEIGNISYNSKKYLYKSLEDITSEQRNIYLELII